MDYRYGIWNLCFRQPAMASDLDDGRVPRYRPYANGALAQSILIDIRTSSWSPVIKEVKDVHLLLACGLRGLRRLVSLTLPIENL